MYRPLCETSPNSTSGEVTYDETKVTFQSKVRLVAEFYQGDSGYDPVIGATIVAKVYLGNETEPSLLVPLTDSGEGIVYFQPHDVNLIAVPYIFPRIISIWFSFIYVDNTLILI